MLPVSISYKYLRFFRYKKTCHIPESFQEFTRKCILHYAGLIGQELTIIDFRLKFLSMFFKLPVRRINKLARTNPEQYIEYNSRLFLFSERFRYLLEEIRIIKNLVPRVRIRTWNPFRLFLYGPSGKLKNLVIWEFALAEKAYIDFRNTKDQIYLDRLFAILYRPGKAFNFFRKHLSNYDNDVRIRFRDDRIDKRQKQVTHIPVKYKNAAYLFFESVRNTFPDLFPHIYNQYVESGDDNGQTWGDVIITMSGEIPGNEEKTAYVNLYAFLYRLEHNAIKYQEWKIKNQKA